MAPAGTFAPSSDESARPAHCPERVEAALRARVAGLSQAQAAAPPAGDEWSAIDVVAHLVDTDYFYLAEAMAMRDTAGHHFRYFDDAAWKLSHPEVRRLPIAACLDALALSHLVVLESLDAMTNDQISLPGIHPRGIPYTVADLFQRLVTHDEAHIRQLDDILDALA